MFNRLSAHNGIFRLPPIQRKDDDELNIAIADLEDRGFHVVRKGIHYNETNYSHSTWVVMEKTMN